MEVETPILQPLYDVLKLVQKENVVVRRSQNFYIFFFLLLVVGLAVGTFARFYLVSWIGERVVADIRKQVFNHLINLHPGFYENNRSSEIQSRLTADTTLLQSVIGSSLSMFLRNLLMVIDASCTGQQWVARSRLRNKSCPRTPSFNSKTRGR